MVKIMGMDRLPPFPSMEKNDDAAPRMQSARAGLKSNPPTRKNFMPEKRFKNGSQIFERAWENFENS
jgi:hypothetical protein